MADIKGRLSNTVQITGRLSDNGVIIGVLQAAAVPPYNGPYEITPTGAEQVLETKGKAMRNNVTIAPIPQNYGLITWNGAFLTVS